MKPSIVERITFPRACAILLSVGGACWAMVVGLAMLFSFTSPKTAFVTALYFLPGWIVYFGWLTLAKGDRPTPLTDRIFWLISAVVNLGYFVHEFHPWKWLSGSNRSLNIAAYWWLFASFLSVICFFATQRRNKPQSPPALGCRGMGIGFLIAAVTVLIGFGGVYLWSARIPDRWQEIAPGMTRSEVAAFVGVPPRSTDDGRDRWTVDRPIGVWNLYVSYHEDATFSCAHLAFTSPVFGEDDRARNYSSSDAPYKTRAIR